MNSIVIIDTGIDLSNIKIRERLKRVEGVKIVKNENGDPNIISTIDDPLCINDTTGHGTAVTDIILRHNPNANIFFVKLFDIDKLEADETTLVYALEYVLHNVIFEVVNLSLGLCSIDKAYNLRRICNEYNSRGKIIVSAFDNNGSISFPASYDNVIGVTSDDRITNDDDYYAVIDQQVNICAKGRNQRIIWLNSKNIIASGNSFACAHFTGIISLLPTELKRKDLWKIVTKNAVKTIDIEKNKPSVNLANPVSNYKKVVAFPFNKEIHSLIRFQDELPFDLVDIYDIKYSARVGSTTNHLLHENYNKNYTIKNIKKLEYDSFDTFVLGHVDIIKELIGDEFIDNLIINLLDAEKNIYAFENISKFSTHRNYNKVFFPYISQNNCETVPFGKLYRQDKPVLGVFGTSSKQGKFTVQLSVRYELLKRGYKLFQLGTEPSALLYGMNSVYPSGYNSTISIYGIEAVAHLNKTIYENSRDADLIIVGGQAGVLPLDVGNINNYNYASIDLLFGTLPDAIVLCVNPSDDVELIKRTINFLEGISYCKVIALSIYPFYFKDSDVTQQHMLKMDHDVYDKEYKDKYLHNFSIPAYLMNNKKCISELCDLIEHYFRE